MNQTKELTNCFNQWIQSEKKVEECKKYRISLRTQIKEKEELLSSTTNRLKSTEKEFDLISNRIPKTIVKVMAIQSENKILDKQIENFEPKIADLKQKQSELNLKRKESVDKLSEQSMNFWQIYGINGCLRTQNNFCRKRLQSIEQKRNQLKARIESLDSKYLESISIEKNSLKDTINELKNKLTTLRRQNPELKLINVRLKEEQKRLSDSESESTQINDLKIQLQKIEIQDMEQTNESRPLSQSKPKVNQIKDLNESNDNLCDQRSHPVIKSEGFKKTSEHFPHLIERKKIKRDLKTVRRDDEIWELIRQRSLRRKIH